MTTFLKVHEILADSDDAQIQQPQQPEAQLGAETAVKNNNNNNNNKIRQDIIRITTHVAA